MSGADLTMRFRIAAELSRVAELRTRLRRFLERTCLPLDERGRHEVVLALDEAATNIVVHGYRGNGGIIDVEYETTTDGLVIRLWDDGLDRVGDDCVGLPVGSVGEGGMGTNIMRASFSSVIYEKRNGRNLLELRRALNHASWTKRRDNRT